MKLTSNWFDRALKIKGVPFFEFVNRSTFGVATSSPTNVLWLLFVISIDLSLIYRPAFYLRTFVSRLSPTSTSNTGAGKGGYTLKVGVAVTFSLVQICGCWSQSTAPILKMPMFSVEKVEYSGAILLDFPSTIWHDKISLFVIATYHLL